MRSKCLGNYLFLVPLVLLVSGAFVFLQLHAPYVENQISLGLMLTVGIVAVLVLSTILLLANANELHYKKKLKEERNSSLVERIGWGLERGISILVGAGAILATPKILTLIGIPTLMSIKEAGGNAFVCVASYPFAPWSWWHVSAASVCLAYFPCLEVIKAGINRKIEKSFC